MCLILDIETIGIDFDSLDKTTQKSLSYWIEREAKSETEYQELLENLKQRLGFSPLTGEIVALGVLDYYKNKGIVYFQTSGEKIGEFSKDNFTFKPATEPEMLQRFWEGAKKYNLFVTFNGRSFDIPFIMIRSAKYKIKPTKDLLSNRYLSNQKSDSKHIDLLDQLSFYGVLKKRGNLHMWCKLFGIKSPKAEGITGEDISLMFKNGQYKKIAEYNSWDLIATKELYTCWKNYLSFEWKSYASPGGIEPPSRA